MKLELVPISKHGEIPLQLHRASDQERRADLPLSRLTAPQTGLLKQLEDRKHAARKQYMGQRTPVLLLHGASAGRDTFLFPSGASLTDFLLRYTNLEPWLLDWRGSKNVTDGDLGAAIKKVFTFDYAAEEDIPAALETIRSAYGNAELPIRAVGHCMGAAILARAIAGGELHELRPTDIVLSTIGLFFEVAVDGRLKAQDRLLERLWSDGNTQLIDPRCDQFGAPRNRWPDELEKMFSAWPDWFKPHRDVGHKRNRSGTGLSPDVLETCNRLSFMYGEPYYEPALNPEIHASRNALENQFGAIPLQMYLHAVQSVRRGWIAEFEDEDKDDIDSAAFVDKFVGKAARDHFDGMNITLITGALNRLWHRDSVDRMYEWLLRDDGRAKLRRCEKIIFRRNGHQDLLWGTNSWTEVFPRIADALTA